MHSFGQVSWRHVDGRSQRFLSTLRRFERVSKGKSIHKFNFFVTKASVDDESGKGGRPEDTFALVRVPEVLSSFEEVKVAVGGNKDGTLHVYDCFDI